MSDELVEAMVRNITYSIFYLDPDQRRAFVEWLDGHVGFDVVENGRLNGHLTAWLKSLPTRQALCEGSVIMDKISGCRTGVQ